MSSPVRVALRYRLRAGSPWAIAIADALGRPPPTLIHHHLFFFFLMTILFGHCPARQDFSSRTVIPPGFLSRSHFFFQKPPSASGRACACSQPNFNLPPASPLVLHSVSSPVDDVVG